MKVFADLHHGSLYYSLQLLIEKRLGWELYRPIGMEWYHERYWTIADPYPLPLNTAGQYLGTDHEEYVPYKQLNGDYYLNEEGVYYVYDPDHDIHQKAIRLKQFKEMDIDIVIASYLGNIISFRKLVDEYQPKAKLVHQMGNNWINAVDFGLVKNLMSSTKKITVPEGVNAAFYHQEFDTNVFSFEDKYIGNRIVCMMNGLQSYPDSGMFFQMEKEMPGWVFKCYGAGNRDGTISGYKNVAETIKNSTFVWHVKMGGDGYGHIIHNAFACGKPPIVRYDYYKGQLAAELMKDGDTCIFIDGLTIQEVINKVEYFNDPVRYQAMSTKAYQAFLDKVDFSKEEQDLRKFFNVLI